jgi:hypothetical protein
VFLDFFSAIEPGALYTPETIRRIAFLISEKAGRAYSGRAHGRFASLLRDQDTSNVPDARTAGTDYAGIAFAFTLLVEKDGLWGRNSVCLDNSSDQSASSFLVVSPSLTVTLMPGFPLKELLPLVSCMEVQDIQIAGQFQITRKSCAAAFDLGFSAEAISDIFRKGSSQPVPQNVIFSIQDWFRSYTSVSLYHGYILSVDEGRRVLFENNEHLSSLIRTILAPGLYLLTVESQEEIQAAFSRANLDFFPGVHESLLRPEPVRLPALHVSSFNEKYAHCSVPVSLSGFRERHQEELLAVLESMQLNPDLYAALKSRIERNIVLSPAQLVEDSVRIEKLEARGVDFLGKVRLVESALQSLSMLEIGFDEKEGNRLILGRPVSTEKRPGDVLLRIVTEPDQVVEEVSIGKAVLVRRIRGSIFSEPPV